MRLSESIEEFRTKINSLVDKLEEVSTKSQKIPSVEVDQLSSKLSELMEDLEEVSSQLGTSTDILDEIRGRWG
jgi:ElaB/YqjD/DUF883 family membrane-anchored ribosome-binding protein